MKELLRVQLDARQIGNALEDAVAARMLGAHQETVAIDVPNGTTLTVVMRRKRAPRRAKQVASAAQEAAK